MNTKIEQFTAKNPNPVLSVSMYGIVLYSNEAGEPLLHEWGVRVGEELPSIIVDIVRSVIHRNSPEKMEVKVGNRIYLLTFNPISEECVNIYGFDISDQKVLEEKLRESERRLSETQRMGHIGNWYNNLVTGEVYWSAGTYHIFGLNQQEGMDFNRFLSHIHPDYRDCVYKSTKDALDGKSYATNYRIIRPDGKERIIRSERDVTFDESNNPVLISGTIQDITELYEWSEKLQKSEEKYRNIVETSNEGIYFVNDEGKVTFANKMMETSGYSLDEIIGRPVWNFIPEESLPIAKKEFEKRRKGISGSYELKLIRKDGSYIWAYITAKPFFNKKGRFKGYLAVMTDITERKEAEEKLRESEEKYRNIVETANEGIYLVNSDNIITYANQKVADISGYKLEEVIGKSVLDFVSEECKLIAKEHLEKRRIGVSKSYELKLLLKDGTSLWASINSKPFFDKDGKFTGYLGMLTDITERKVAEGKLRESEEKYRNIVEIANEGILLIDSELRVTFYNKKSMEMLGYNSEEGLGRPIWDFISKESIPIAKSHMEKRQRGINESYELELICKDGSTLWVLLNAKSLFDKDGKFMGSISMITDISERKKAEEALANFELARQKEIHHRIKNNLQVISSLLDLQADRFIDKQCINESEVLEAFKESQDRVISMALIHEELYKGGGFETLNFSPYIEKLARNLFQTYSLGKTEINLKWTWKKIHFLIWILLSH